MKPQINWMDEDDIPNVWSWQTRIGIGPYFSDGPMRYYQQDHCRANDVLYAWAEGQEIWYSEKDNCVYRTDGKCITIYELNRRIDRME